MPQPCDDELEKLQEANEELADAKQTYEDALEASNEAMENYQYAFVATVVGAVGGLATGVGALPVIGGVGAAEVGLKALENTWNSAARELINAKTKYIEKQSIGASAQHDLEHCRKDNADADGDGKAAKDDPDDDMPQGDADMEDFMPLGDEDYEETEWDEEGMSEDNSDGNAVVECSECGYEGPEEDFDDDGDTRCPYCETRVDIS